jgi:glutamate N-acetyltransferase/amino-acid N-acetyltransferase
MSSKRSKPPVSAPKRAVRGKSAAAIPKPRPKAEAVAKPAAPVAKTGAKARSEDTHKPFRLALRRAILGRATASAAERGASAHAGAAGHGADRNRAAKPKLVSPLAPQRIADLPPLAGVKLAAGAAGIRYPGRNDLLLVELAPKTAVAGVFTASRMPSAPVDWCRTQIGGGTARALVVNSGNANAFTGKAGADAVKTTAAACAKLVGCKQGEVFVASTGVIGEALPAEKVAAALPGVHAKVADDGWRAAADAIMTTDTYPKLVTRRAVIDDATVTINGIAKGSGMIAPDLGTMLAFIFTDAAIPAAVLQTLLIVEMRETFNAITVDSDTSTSDTVLLFATGRGPRHGPVQRPGAARLRDFRQTLTEVMRELAHQVVRDGEGATKFITVRVTGAASGRAARAIALAIGNSPLVKTAIAGEDPNWGRIVMAVGKAGEAADRDRLSIRFGPHLVARDGRADPAYDEKRVAAYMKEPEILIDVDVGVGTSTATIWTCDLTHRYIDINADYRS